MGDEGEEVEEMIKDGELWVAPGEECGGLRAGGYFVISVEERISAGVIGKGHGIEGLLSNIINRLPAELLCANKRDTAVPKEMSESERAERMCLGNRDGLVGDGRKILRRYLAAHNHSNYSGVKIGRRMYFAYTPPYSVRVVGCWCYYLWGVERFSLPLKLEL